MAKRTLWLVSGLVLTSVAAAWLWFAFSGRATYSRTPPLPACAPLTEHRANSIANNDSIEEPVCAAKSTKKFPDAIIIGVRKGGTRALIDMLKAHPQLKAARGEVHYFDRDENFENGVSWYIERMPYTATGEITIEKSPSYFISREAPRRLFLYSRGVKLIVILRDPVERAISDFVQLDAKKQKKQTRTTTFEQTVLRANGSVRSSSSVISVSLYDEHLQRWLEFFNREQVHVVNGDKLIASPWTELRKVEEYLGIARFFQEDMFYFNKTKGFYCWKVSGGHGDNEPLHCLGSGKGRKHPSVSDELIAKLRAFFEPHNKNLYSLTGESYNW